MKSIGVTSVLLLTLIPTDALHAVRYTWSHEGKAHGGSITLSDDDAEFTDSFHQPQPMTCPRLPDAGGAIPGTGRVWSGVRLGVAHWIESAEAHRRAGPTNDEHRAVGRRSPGRPDDLLAPTVESIP